PPSGLDQMGLFWWMTIFTILVRLSLTLFIVPSMSLGAELSTDYDERTSITSYRVMFAAFISTIIIIIGFAFFFVPTEEYSRGLMNKDAYPKFALLCGILITLVILISTWGTRKEIPRLQEEANKTERKRISFSQLFANFSNMIALKSFNTLVIYTMIIYIGIGIGTVLTTYFIEYYFVLSDTEKIALPISSGLGGIIALILAPIVSKKFDKKITVVFSTILFALLFTAPYNLRLLGLFPENGTSSLILYFMLSLMAAYAFLWIVLSIINSMMADIVDEYELKTNQRDEGLFFSTLSLAYKMTVGFGYLIAGYLLKWINFPSQTSVEDVPADIIASLGTIGGPVLLCIYLVSVLAIIFYPINKTRYQEIRDKLDEKR
ncbi:MAG: GPH family glycoside/pentoside/hexuronide:cation symporter, partial [Maribacter sp.]